MAQETKSLTVSPSEEQNTIELYQSFGWELKSSQEIFNKDSHLESRSDGTYNVTTTTNYVKLVFSREKTIPHYDELVKLENDYSLTVLPIKPSGKVLFILGGILIVGGVASLPIGLAYGIPGIGLIVWGAISRNKKMKKYYADKSAVTSKRREILSKALSLLNDQDK